jgi:hypothetical protein
VRSLGRVSATEPGHKCAHPSGRRSPASIRHWVDLNFGDAITESQIRH